MVTSRQGSYQPSVLVLGAGFMGAAIGRAMLDRGCAVSVVTRTAPLAFYRDLLTGAAVHLGDAQEAQPVADLVAEADHVVIALGSSSPVQSDFDPASDITSIVPPVIRLLELLRINKHAGLTFLSSGGAVYGHKPPRPIRETAAARPISSYGIIKLTCEKYLSMYADLHGIPVRIVRVANAYGPGQTATMGQGLVAHLMQAALTGDVLPLYGARRIVRDFVFIDDVARAVAALTCAQGVPRIVNIGTGVGHPIGDLVDLVEHVSGREIRTTHLPQRPFDVRSNVLDVSLLRGLVPYRPLELREGLERTWSVLDGELLRAQSS